MLWHHLTLIQTMQMMIRITSVTTNRDRDTRRSWVSDQFGRPTEKMNAHCLRISHTRPITKRCQSGDTKQRPELEAAADV